MEHGDERHARLENERVHPQADQYMAERQVQKNFCHADIAFKQGNFIVAEYFPHDLPGDK